jgi:hypothetical protein
MSHENNPTFSCNKNVKKSSTLYVGFVIYSPQCAVMAKKATCNTPDKKESNMFKVWGKIIKENHLERDTTVEVTEPMSRTQKVYKALELICNEFDLAVPVWLESNQNEFIKHAKTRFRDVNFMEEIEFDYLDFQVIDEDHPWE